MLVWPNHVQQTWFGEPSMIWWRSQFVYKYQSAVRSSARRKNPPMKNIKKQIKKAMLNVADRDVTLTLLTHVRTLAYIGHVWWEFPSIKVAMLDTRSYLIRCWRRWCFLALSPWLWRFRGVWFLFRDNSFLAGVGIHMRWPSRRTWWRISRHRFLYNYLSLCGSIFCRWSVNSEQNNRPHYYELTYNISSTT